VTEVMVAARNARQFLGNKQAPGRLGTKSLDDHGGYNKERQHFLNIGKAHNPIAASGAAHEVLSGGTQQQYEALPSSPDKLVNYFRRDSRLSMMAFIEGGRFYVGVAPISCTVEDYGGPCVTAWVYAVDRHGSMFVYDFFNADRDGRLMGYFNHSSFCAGREVMTAGTVVFLDGTLKYISNASGHYKPDANHLRNYLVLLGQEGVDLGGVAVEDIMRGTFRGSSILRNPGCAPDWPVTAKFHNKTGKIGVQHNGMTYRVQQPAG
jgi:hypothetical protein